MQFLYRAPIGLVQTTLDGTVEMINPMSASLLMPLSRTGNLDNLFVVLDAVAPQSAWAGCGVRSTERHRVRRRSGSISPARSHGLGPTVLSVSLVKLDGAATDGDVQRRHLDVQREQLELARGLNDAARTDRLTQMPNRAVVRDQIQQVLDRPPREPRDEFAVLFMNCDRFTQINDRLGHARGRRTFWVSLPTACAPHCVSAVRPAGPRAAEKPLPGPAATSS